MIVVLEGLPGSGKTTALHRLEGRLGFTGIEEIIGNESTNSAEDFYVRNDRQKYQHAQDNGVYILDRNFVSTLCYNYCSDKIRSTANFTYVTDKINTLLRKSELRQPDAYIYLTCSVATSQRRQNQTNDSLWLNKNCLYLAANFYAQYLKRQSVPVLTIDTERYNASEVATKIEDFINILVGLRKPEKLYV